MWAYEITFPAERGDAVAGLPQVQWHREASWPQRAVLQSPEGQVLLVLPRTSENFQQGASRPVPLPMLSAQRKIWVHMQFRRSGQALGAWEASKLRLLWHRGCAPPGKGGFAQPGNPASHQTPHTPETKLRWFELALGGDDGKNDGDFNDLVLTLHYAVADLGWLSENRAKIQPLGFIQAPGVV